ncbi:hypothetical protein EMIHUDRAFT_245239 [Emiliania huxleyi CCMP1516]|uniref:GATA-type domain-containing protein n=2 Tax=Emiliania huxleyi TaxID=2903 RepID=A0A0D3IY32_EMIH1|nr:hypothetical protein EMIHUDRAFT_245239 [Emiliania huxleyi CCMP1516]EOD16167.1 hypothetical protein EMIHUDRAFT_245239 [Emiliania huxleyi CCMP1516]|eukprot:XP_005768596.1 hypothetical protein EMIHUDRAFT_245239 [Emiliania huxleyi CCMP1516]
MRPLPLVLLLSLQGYGLLGSGEARNAAVRAAEKEFRHCAAAAKEEGGRALRALREADAARRLAETARLTAEDAATLAAEEGSEPAKRLADAARLAAEESAKLAAEAERLAAGAAARRGSASTQPKAAKEAWSAFVRQATQGSAEARAERAARLAKLALEAGGDAAVGGRRGACGRAEQRGRRAAETPTPSAAAARTRATSQTNRGEDAQTEVCPMCGSGMGMATNHGHLPLWLCQKCGYSKRHSERPSWRVS